MSTNLALAHGQQQKSVLAAMGSRFGVEPGKLLSTLQSTVFKGANEAQMVALCIVANEFNLNPFTKQIYAFPDKGGGIVPVVGVDGWAKIMNEHPKFDGIEFELAEENGRPVSCTAIVHVKDRSHPVKVTEYYAECARNSEPWNKSPRRMLRHKALIQAARVAFGFCGIHDPEEAELIAAKPLQATVVQPPMPVRPKLAAPAPAPVAEPEPAPKFEATAEGPTGPVGPGGVAGQEFTPAEEAGEVEVLRPIEDELRELCEQHEVGEADILAYLIGKKRAPRGAETFEELSAGHAAWAREKFAAIASFLRGGEAAQTPHA